MMKRATNDDPAPSENKKQRQESSEVVDLTYNNYFDMSLEETIQFLDKTIESAKNFSDLEDDSDFEDYYKEPQQQSKRKGRPGRKRQRRLYNPSDVVWVRHDSGANSCFWPCFVKNVRAKKIAVLYICYNTFEKGEKCFMYPITSKKVKPFHIMDNTEEVEAGNKVYCKTTQEGKDFREACQLAQAFVHQRAMGRYPALEEGIEFFRTRGYDYYLEPSDDIYPGSSSSSGKDDDRDDKPGSSSSSALADPPAVPPKPFEAPIDRYIRLEEKKAKEGTDAFIKRCSAVVDYIVEGNCDSVVKEIAEYKQRSSRMDEFTERWENGGPVPLPTFILPKNMYFYCDDQAQTVARYVRHLTEEVPRPARCPEPQSITRQAVFFRELCLDVFYPEAVIHAIGKCFRRDRYRSVQMFKAGYSGPRSVPKSLVAFTNDEEEEEDGEPLRL